MISVVQRSRPSSRPTPLTAVLGAAIVLSLLPGCGASLPRPPTGPTPRDAMIEVPYPPPPARVETIPAQTRAGDVWIDGQWSWDGKVWRWQPGAWTTPPANAYFTPWTTVRRPDGRLEFAAATWRTKDGKSLAISPGAALCAAASPPPHASEAVSQ